MLYRRVDHSKFWCTNAKFFCVNLRNLRKFCVQFPYFRQGFLFFLSTPRKMRKICVFCVNLSMETTTEYRIRMQGIVKRWRQPSYASLLDPKQKTSFQLSTFLTTINPDHDGKRPFTWTFTQGFISAVIFSKLIIILLVFAYYFYRCHSWWKRNGGMKTKTIWQVMATFRLYHVELTYRPMRIRST